MKQITIVFLFTIFCLANKITTAQDLLIFKNNKVKKVKVIEITDFKMYGERERLQISVRAHRMPRAIKAQLRQTSELRPPDEENRKYYHSSFKAYNTNNPAPRPG